MTNGKIPPQATDLEEAILGAIMIDKKGMDEVAEILCPDAFYKDAHKLIFQAQVQLYNDRQPIDLLTVSNKLKETGNLKNAGGDFYLIELTQKVASSAHIEYHARIVLQKYILRNLIQISAETNLKSYDDTVDVFDLLDETEAKLFDISQNNLKTQAETTSTLLQKVKQRVQDVSKKTGISGIPSGFKDIDALTSGWQDSDLIIIAARPGIGKTSFVLSMARNIAIDYNIPVAIFSLEMSSVQLMGRLVSMETRIGLEKLRNGKLSDEEWLRLNTHTERLNNSPIFIDDTAALSIFDLRAKARRLVMKEGVKIIFIDYLQLMTVGNSKRSNMNREQEISTISRNLKALAKELNVPVIALSQLSRKVEERSGVHKRPMLSDLRDSGAIEQDADIVGFLYSPSYYGIEQWDGYGEGSTAGQVEWNIEKHRNGDIDRDIMRFEKEYTLFSDIEEETYQPKITKVGRNYYEPDKNNDLPF